jgi:hypothetical protein
MHDEYKEDKTNNTEYGKEDNLYSCEGKERNDTRDDEWENEEYECHEYGTEVEEDHREVELPGDSYMSHSERSRCREGCDRSLSFEDDKKLRIRKAHIDKKSKTEVSPHDDADTREVSDSEHTKEEYIEGNDRKWTKYCGKIVGFKDREKVSESIEESLKRSMIVLSMSLLIGINHLYHSSGCNRL